MLDNASKRSLYTAGYDMISSIVAWAVGYGSIAHSYSRKVPRFKALLLVEYT